MYYASAQKVCIKLTLEFLDLFRNLCCLRVMMVKSWLEHISAGTPGPFQLKIGFCSVLNARQATQVKRRERTSAHSPGTNTHKPARPAQTSSHQALFVSGVTGERRCLTCMTDPLSRYLIWGKTETYFATRREVLRTLLRVAKFICIHLSRQSKSWSVNLRDCVAAREREPSSHASDKPLCGMSTISHRSAARDTTINPSRGATGIIRGRFCPVLPGCCRHLCRVGNSYSGYWMFGAWGVWGVRSGSFILFPFLNSSLESSCGERRVSGYRAAVHNAPCGRAHRGTSAPAKVRLPMGFSHFNMLTQGQF